MGKMAVRNNATVDQRHRNSAGVFRKYEAPIWSFVAELLGYSSKLKVVDVVADKAPRWCADRGPKKGPRRRNERSGRCRGLVKFANSYKFHFYEL